MIPKISLGILFIGLMLLSSSYGKDITSKDGSIYKNVEVIKVIPDGIIIEYKEEKTGFDVLKNLKYEILPTALLNEYKIDTAKAKEFEKEFDSSKENRFSKDGTIQKEDYIAEENAELEKYNKMSSDLENKDVSVNFKSDQIIDGGTLGWATKDDEENDIDLGKIFIKGAFYEPSFEFTGKVYPTKETKKLEDGTIVPVYDSYKYALDKITEESLNGGKGK